MKPPAGSTPLILFEYRLGELEKTVGSVKDDLSEGQDTLIAMLDKISDKLDGICDKYDDKISKLENDRTDNRGNIKRLDDKVDGIDKRVNAWGTTNSLGVVVAAILAYFGLK